MTNSSSTTTAAPGAQPPPALNILVTVSTYILLALVMFGMACTVTLEAMKETFRNKKPFLIAISCQTILMPALAFLVGRALQLNDLHSICLLLLGCCPGGSFSNVLCYFANGNQALSIGLTCFTNLCCVFTLPLLLWVWGSSFTSVTIPYGDILVSFSLVIFPALFGIWVRHKSAKHAKYGERVGSIGGASMVLGAAISGFVANGETLADRDLLPATTLVSVLIVGPMGMLCSFLIAYFFPIGPRMATQDIVTISLETGVQNTVLALAIVNISFSDVLSPFELFQAQFFPICWGLFVLLEGSLLVLGYRLYLRKTKKEPAEIVLVGAEGEGKVVEEGETEKL